MDFFQHQDTARQRTGLLVVLFSVAVLTITALISVVSIAIYLRTTGEPLEPRKMAEYSLYCFLGVAFVVGMSSAIRLHDLGSNGGRGVAESMGGKLISTDTTNSKHRQLLNVVEEMAIAAGMPVPPVYVMEKERGINAFAAGMSIDDAVIGVTQGSLDAFSRDELQGVIAHEFSHILNGDMRLNTRLIGILFGITCIAWFGHLVLDNMPRSRRSSSDSDKGIIVIFLVAIVCVVLGWLGTLFGSMIKAAISRQREFLADASAVQFTRNDRGIAGALKKIGGHTSGSCLDSRASQEMSHMMFGQSKLSGLSGMFATHPPLEERILRIEPGWDGEYSEGHRTSGGSVHAQASGFAGGAASPQQSGPETTPEQEHVSAAGQKLISQLPPELADMAREPYSARFITLMLIFDGTDTQRSAITNHIPPAAQPRMMPWLDYDLPHHLHLPLLELAVPALKSLSDGQKHRLCEVLRELAQMDNHYSLSEWCVINLLEKQLLPSFGKTSQHKTLKQVEESALWVLRELAWVCHPKPEKAQQAYAAALKHIGMPVQQLEASNQNWKLTRVALELLVQLKPKDKHAFVKACRIAVESDGRITVAEGELYRVIACFLEVPEPPLTISDAPSA